MPVKGMIISRRRTHSANFFSLKRNFRFSSGARGDRALSTYDGGCRLNLMSNLFFLASDAMSNLRYRDNCWRCRLANLRHQWLTAPYIE